jgi:hypothetical protein
MQGGYAASRLQSLPGDAQRLLTVLGGPVQFASMCPDRVKPPRFAIFEAGDPATDDFVQRSDLEERACYYSLNVTRPGIATKATKLGIIAARGAHVDIDPPKDGGAFDKAAVLDKLKASAMPPSYVVDSGGGLQPVWLFDGHVTDFELVEGINRALIARYGGDPGTFNIDRLLRVPGSLNTPNAKKAAAGRQPARAGFAL